MSHAAPASQHQTTKPSAAAVPLVLATPVGPCLAWFHPARGGAAGPAVVVCGPALHETVVAYPTLVQLTRGLADAGCAVLRFDWPGSGDSSGSDDAPGRLQAWRDSIDAAAAQLRQLSGAQDVALLGIRLGGTLACEAAVRWGGVESLVLWAAPATGREFARELRLAGRELPDGGWQVAGFRCTADTMRGLVGLQACPPGARPAARVLLVDRDDMASTGALADRLRQAGAMVERAEVPGYAAMLRGEAAGALAGCSLAMLADWLRLPALAARAARAAQPIAGPSAAQWSDGEVTESVVRFGEQALCGVLSAPANTSSPAVGVVLLSVGNNYRVGPHRLTVAMARALAADGCRTLRFDLAGFGDSHVPGGKPPLLYDPGAAADVQAAIDLLQQQGCREIVLAGICSGAYLAFQTALVDRRVRHLAVINARLLRWTPGRPGDGWEQAHELNVRTLRSYRQRLSSQRTWQRLAHGEFTPRWIAGRARALLLERCRQVASWVPGALPTVRALMRGLCERGTRVLLLVGEADDTRGYAEYHFGRAGSRMKGCRHFQMEDVPGDHSFNGPGDADQLVARLRAFVARGLVPDSSRVSVPAPLRTHAPTLPRAFGE